MGKVAIVTDSSAYIPKDFVKNLNIKVVPLVVIWGNETLEDDVDITPEQFYNRLKSAKEMPTTSRFPSPICTRLFQDSLNKDTTFWGFSFPRSCPEQCSQPSRDVTNYWRAKRR